MKNVILLLVLQLTFISETIGQSSNNDCKMVDSLCEALLKSPELSRFNDQDAEIVYYERSLEDPDNLIFRIQIDEIERIPAGWIVISRKTNEVHDISNDPENPIKISIDKDFVKKALLSCTLSDVNYR